MESVIDFEKGICSVCRQRQVSRWCDYITEYQHFVTFFRKYEDMVEYNRRGVGYKTCDLPICNTCAKEVSLDTHLCPHHYQLQKQAELLDPYQKERQKRERMKIQMELMKLSESEKSNADGQINLFE